MAPEWEMGMGMGMEFGMGMGMGASISPSIAASGAPIYGNTSTTGNSPAYLYGLPSADTLRIDDLLDFSNPDVAPSATAVAATADAHLFPALETSSAAGEAGSSSDYHSHLTSFPDDLYIPSEEAAELEWLSKFVEDSFSDVPYPDILSGAAHVRADPTSTTAPGRGARSKRSRNSSAANWSSVAPPPAQPSSSSSTSSSSSSDFPPGPKPENGRRKSAAADEGLGLEGGVRRCTHCASEKTPQWRTGPLGPKTLCNACGVRYKSGRLVPEYRPAASPTFMLTQHSNSHRKVMELRRQKEVYRHVDGNNSSSSSPVGANSAAAAAAAARGELIFHDYEVC